MTFHPTVVSHRSDTFGMIRVSLGSEGSART
jgi:hypothetical protein